MGLIGITFGLVVWAVMNVTGTYLVNQRVSEELSVVDALALEVTADVREANADALYETLVERGRENDARLLVTDETGTVWVDSLSELNGVRLGHGEITDITSQQMDRSYGFHRVQSEAFTLSNGEWIGYYTCAVTDNGRLIGTVMMVSSLQDLTRSLDEIQNNIILFFVAVLIIVLAVGLYFGSVITRPINDLNTVMQQTARTGFTVRANPRGNDEIAQLGRTFNMMSEKLQNMDQMRSDFISNASHELKTPLSAMKILIESILHQETPDPSMTREFLGDINQEIDRLSAIVGDLLTIVRFDSRSEKLQMEPIALDELLFDTLSRLSPVANRAGIALEPSCDELCFVNGDPIKLQQVIYNLCDNAVKYTPRGGTVWVRLYTEAGRAVIEVKDNGIGIPKESIPHIFERFYRVDKARSRSTGGTGLGLSIVQSMVHLHGGDIEVESEEGVGTTFRVYLPLVKDPYADFVDEEEEEAQPADGGKDEEDS